jgi:hypothetical protein
MRRARCRARLAQRGVAAVVFVIIVPVLLGLIGFALDLGRMYTRKAELQHVADAAALAAGGQLNGTPGGVTKASQAAQAVLLDSYYGFNKKLGFYWSDQALTFASDPHAPASAWLSVNDAKQLANAPTALYARFDTSKLAQPDGMDQPGVITLSFSTVLGVEVAPTMEAAAVAGKLSSPVTPLAVCTMSPNPTDTHINATGVPADALAYGFRTGVSYNLLQISPSGTSRQAYLVDPVDSPVEKNNIHFTQAYMQPFMCAGSVALGQVVGRQVYIKALPDDFQGDGWNLVDWLNSRFGASNGACDTSGAPPDSNVREFDGLAHDPAWYMITTTFDSPAAKSTTRNNGNGLVAVPDLVKTDILPPATSFAPKDFGPLWAYSKPVQSNGAGFTTSSWPGMYFFGADKAQGANANYPTGKNTPYLTHVTAPASGTGVAGRRVLNVPLLNCAANTNDGLGTVVAIGRFFMTGKATKDVIPGEFAGINNLSGPAVLFR